MKMTCPKCSREIDPRGFKAHVRTHDEEQSSPRKPVTSTEVPSTEWRTGYRHGVLDALKMAS